MNLNQAPKVLFYFCVFLLITLRWRLMVPVNNTQVRWGKATSPSFLHSYLLLFSSTQLPSLRCYLGLVLLMKKKKDRITQVSRSLLLTLSQSYISFCQHLAVCGCLSGSENWKWGKRNLSIVWPLSSPFTLLTWRFLWGKWRLHLNSKTQSNGQMEEERKWRNGVDSVPWQKVSWTFLSYRQHDKSW